MDNRGYIALAIIFLVVALTLLRSTGAAVDFYEDSNALGQRTGHNLVSGAGILVSGTDDPANSRVNITISTNASSGSATLEDGETFVMVTHGLGSAPDRVQLTPTTDPGSAAWYVSSKTATQFAITLVAVHGTDITFDWRASKDE